MERIDPIMDVVHGQGVDPLGPSPSGRVSLGSWLSLVVRDTKEEIPPLPYNAVKLKIKNTS